jgi:hypothetical protein
MQIKTTMSFTSVKMAVIKKMKKTSIVKVQGKSEPLCAVGGDVN